MTTWKEFIEQEKNEEYFKEIERKVKIEREKTIVYPPEEKVLRLFDLCEIENIKVVILGMDPYINRKQANGIAFAVEENYTIPPSLRNIFQVAGVPKESQDRTLIPWVEQGVFLLNTVLTVEAGESNSHYKIGWQQFTHKVIKKISEEKENIVFMLWGKNAQELEKFISNKEKHLILKSSHPSPFSARRSGTSSGDAFMEADHFNKANEYLKNKNKKEIVW